MENINITKNETVNKVENEKNIKGTINTILMLVFEGLLFSVYILGGYDLRIKYGINFIIYLFLFCVPYAHFIYYPLRNKAGENLKIFNKNTDKLISDLILLISFIFFVFLFKVPMR